jgi:hypothetical protein
MFCPNIDNVATIDSAQPLVGDSEKRSFEIGDFVSE